MIYDQDPIWWYSGKFVQIENTWVWSTQNRMRIIRHGNSSEAIEAWSSEVEDDGEEKYRSKTSITKFWRQKRENWERGGGYESQGNRWYWKRTRSLLTVESKRTVFESRPMQSPARQWWACKKKKKHQKPLHPLSHQHKEVEVRREKRTFRGRSPSGKSNRQPCRNFLKGTCTECLVTIGILPSVNFISQNRGVNSAISARFRTERLRNNRMKSRRRVVTEMQCLLWKMYGSWVACCRVQSRWNLHRFYGRVHKSWDQFDEYDSQKLRSVMLTSEKTQVHRWQKKVKLPHQRSPYALKFEDRS